jgi:hypothetical protein
MKRNNTNSAQYWRKSVLTRKTEMVAITKIPKATHTPKKETNYYNASTGNVVLRAKSWGEGAFSIREKRM